MAPDTDYASNEQSPSAGPPAYRSYLLRLWEERGEHPALSVWRFSLEDPLTARRVGFANLEALAGWLAAEVDGLVSARTIGAG
jgi:hypothetical protein